MFESTRAQRFNMVKELADEMLVNLYKKGSSQAFRVLYLRHQQKVYHFVLRFFNNKEIAEELFQESFLRIFSNIHKYSPALKFTTWMYSIVRNLCIDEYRKKKVRKVISLEDHLKKHFTHDLPDTSSKPVDVNLIHKERSYYVKQAIEKLPHDQKEILILRETEDISFQEISEILGESVNTVKSRMRYALVNLRKSLQEMGVFESLIYKESLHNEVF
ncbi:MAG: sigma-70 family RNA polymerase sigma factor [Deltaproteobacteria bacterium]|nr:sigma-70 family RNA polymerase sigma factor [Deltaproteobacteria bacterium]